MDTINEDYISVENLKHERFAPIVLFVYNRPWHTQQTVEALQKNVYAAESELIIYADAAKNAQAEEKVQEVRKYIKSITGFKSLKIIEQKTNQGLANSIIKGVTEVVNKYGRIIVLEDDIVTSKWFLKYMNDALEVYKNEEKVMQISGYTYPVDNSDLPETFFLPITSSWGWATWSRAWRYFERNPEKLVASFDKEKIIEFNLQGAYDFWSQVISNYKKENHTWAVFWYANVFEKQGLVLYAKESLVNNIGFDGSGENCDENTKFKNILNKNDAVGISCFFETYFYRATILEVFKDFFINLYKEKNFIFRIKNKIRKLLQR